MSQLAQLIKQAKNQRGLDELFNTQAVTRVTNTDEDLESASSSLVSKLDELEVQLFPCIHLSSRETGEIIRSLESVLDDL